MSTPTVSRFEGGERNIQLASPLAILGTLGLLAQPPGADRSRDP